MDVDAVLVQPLLAPFPYFGGKSRVAAEVWARLGDVPNFVEPFFGSGAVLLARPHDYAERIETVNDADGLLANFWRATQQAPEDVAHFADWPVSEVDLHARHLWLVGQRDRIVERMMADPDFCDAQAAGWWLWGICQWIGSGWCSGQGPWHAVDGVLAKGAAAGAGIMAKLPHLGDAGKGINRQLPHLGDAGKGINRQLPHLGNAGMGLCAEWSAHLRTLMQQLADRLRRVRVCCGDWARVCGPSPTTKLGSTGIFLDPPYSAEADRDNSLYTVESQTVAHDVRRWAIAHGDDPLIRIALCGYDSEHVMPANWDAFIWKTRGGYANQGNGSNGNAAREVIWFSPHCLKPARSGARTLTLFEDWEEDAVEQEVAP